MKDLNTYKRLSAVYTADSFFYGMFDNKELLLSKLIAKDKMANITPDVQKKIAVRNSFFALLPNKAYDQKLKSKILNSIPGFSSLRKHVILEDEINDDTVAIWGMDKDTYSSLIDLKNVQRIMHFSSAFIKACLSKSEDGVFIHGLKSHLDIVVIVDGKLELYNFLQYQNKEDLLYYTMLYQSKTNKKATSIFLSGECNQVQQEFLKGYLEHIELLTFDFKIPSIFKSKEFYTGIEAVHLCE